MRKQIKKYGNSLVIVFTKEEQELYGIKEGDKIDLDFLEQSQKENEKEKTQNKNN